MDPLSQAALGAGWAQGAAKRPKVAAATAVGAIAGMAPDIDVLIRSDVDPLLALELHRHFTHALVFVPVGAAICALLLYPLSRRWLSFEYCYLFSLLGYASHGLLDACTSYGTMLFWPFTNKRVAWDIVSVVDPLLTLPMIAFVVLGVVRRQRRLALAGLAWCVLYLGFGVVQHQRAERVAMELAHSRGHVPERVAVKPSFGNLIVWKSIYESEGRFYVDAVRAGIATSVFAGESLVKFDLARDYPWLTSEMQQMNDVERFAWFADGFLAVDDEGRIVDMRYSLVPNRGDGLWGIVLDAEAPADTHAAYVTMRFRSADEGRSLLQMIFDRPVNE
ncbi:MAG: metal-dependent hydrolase [Gammaproteobacteria bacterium]|nr:metal-dependent hydrolase [Gammaproteobacteria bacterium]